MSSENPYAPPQAVVADEPEQVMPRPRVVTVAVWMLWIEVALSSLSALLRMQYSSDTVVVVYVLIGAVLLQGLSALLIYKIWKGRNWARITYLVLTLLALLSWIQMAAAIPNGVKFVPAVETILPLAGTILDLVALYLLFVPGRAWFRRRLRQ